MKTGGVLKLTASKVGCQSSTFKDCKSGKLDWRDRGRVEDEGGCD